MPQEKAAMKPSRFWRSVAQCILGGIGLSVVTLLGFRVGAPFAAVAFADLILIVVLSLIGSFTASIILSFAAVLSLDYFFTQPALSFYVEAQNDVLALAGFLTSSIVITGLAVTLRNMTSQARNVEKELVETVPGLVWSALPDGSRDFHSRRWLEFTGLSSAEAAGNRWSMVFHPEDRVTVVEKWRSAVASGEPFEIEARERNAKDEYRSMLVRAAPLRDARGDIIKWYGSSTDLEDHKRVLKALRDSERHWREIFEHNPVMYFILDATGAIASVNSFGAAQLGHSVEELIGKSVLNVFFEDDREAAKAHFAVCLENLGKSYSWEGRTVRKDGTVIWVRENAKAVRRPDGRVMILVACEDISERKRTEDALRESQMYLAEAQRLSRTGSFGWHVDTGEMIWSEETFRIFECNQATKPTVELVLQRTHPEDRALVRSTLERASGDAQDWEYERRLLLPDGSTKHLHTVAHAVRDAAGELEYIGAVKDVTAVKQVEAALRESEGRFRDYAETASDWLWETDPDHNFTHFTRHGEAVSFLQSRLGVTRWHQATDVESEPEKWRLHWAILDAHQPFRDFVYQTRRDDGVPIYVKVSGKPIFVADGSFLGYRGTATDVTAEVRADQAEADLRRVQAELAHVARVTTLGELTAAIAHEVNQPLTGLVSSGNACLRWLAIEPPNLEAARRAVERIINDGIRAGEVISRIRALATKSPPRKDWVNINETIQEAIALIRGEIERNRVALKIELSSHLPLILGDRIQLQQVIINLIMNAIEAMSGVKPAQRELSVASVNENAGGVLVSVRDSGPGLDSTSADRLFAPFHTTKPEGMGMGLPISRTIIEAHGGELWAARNEPRGAIFQFRLPARGEEASPTPQIHP
jgi:PAS domain S-box-containing protein